ncbi:unnamed protein product [Moneuplotes crassus]|uniref:Uncharacterized protein n=1 Tax=Euplotes crassus TaxID=5936 RepID=A0AAD2D1K5_EUPCR|nr:unnamed protein product [Moneuplotes crassus]
MIAHWWIMRSCRREEGLQRSNSLKKTSILNFWGLKNRLGNNKSSKPNQEELKKISRSKKIGATDTESSDLELEEGSDFMKEEEAQDALSQINPEVWNNIPYPLVDGIKALVRHLRKLDSTIKDQDEKYSKLIEKQKFHITRLGQEIEKIENFSQDKVERIERNFTQAFNDVRKAHENRNHDLVQKIDKEGVMINNVKSKIHRMSLKLDKCDETDIQRSWTLSKIDESRFKLQDFIDFELENIKKEVRGILKEEFETPGLIGEDEQYSTVKEYYQSIEERFDKNQQRFLQVDDNLNEVVDKDIAQIRQDLQTAHITAQGQAEELKHKVNMKDHKDQNLLLANKIEGMKNHIKLHDSKIDLKLKEITKNTSNFTSMNKEKLNIMQKKLTDLLDYDYPDTKSELNEIKQTYQKLQVKIADFSQVQRRSSLLRKKNTRMSKSPKKEISNIENVNVGIQELPEAEAIDSPVKKKSFQEAGFSGFISRGRKRKPTTLRSNC